MILVYYDCNVMLNRVKPSHSGIIQLLRYLVVGGLSFVIDFGCLTILRGVFGVHYLFAAAIGFILGLVANFILSALWVFPGLKLYSGVQFGLYAGVGIIGLGVTELGIWVLTGVVHLDYKISKIIVTGIVFFWNFLARKYILT